MRPVRPLSHRSSRPDPNPPPLLSHLPPLRAGRGQGQSPRSRRGRQDRRGTCPPPSALPTIRPPRPPEFGSPPPPGWLTGWRLSLIHISEPTRLRRISY